MKLQVGPNISNTRVRLDFKKSPDKPDNAPSYEIKKNKAKEFVAKYNNLGSKMQYLTIGTTGMGLLVAHLLSKGKQKTTKILSVVSGGVIGALAGIGVSKKLKLDLMKKYQVKEHNKNKE